MGDSCGVCAAGSVDSVVLAMYLHWNEQTITDFSDSSINALYNEGYVFTRRGKGVMHQTRSLRIDLSKFELSSENRRVLKKTEHMKLISSSLPFQNYHWSIGKMGHDFYENKFGHGTFSANKIKELLTDADKSNFNRVLVYKIHADKTGYCIALETNEILHYSYPFYELVARTSDVSNIGMGMMLRAILWSKEGHVKPDGHVASKKYIYLGSAQRPTDTYKLQFDGIEWFDGKSWSSNLVELKKLL